MTKAGVVTSAAFLAVVAFALRQYVTYRVAPNFSPDIVNLTTVAGEKFTLKDFLAKSSTNSIVIFAQSWCHDCHSELAQLEKSMRMRHAEHTVLVMTDEGVLTAREWQRSSGLPFLFANSTQPFDTLGVHAYPTVYIFNPNLNVAFSKVGRVNWENELASPMQ